MKIRIILFTAFVLMLVLVTGCRWNINVVPGSGNVITESRPADRSTGTNATELTLLHPDLPVLRLGRNATDALATLAKQLAR